MALNFQFPPQAIRLLQVAETHARDIGWSNEDILVPLRNLILEGVIRLNEEQLLEDEVALQYAEEMLRKVIDSAIEVAKSRGLKDKITEEAFQEALIRLNCSIWPFCKRRPPTFGTGSISSPPQVEV